MIGVTCEKLIGTLSSTGQGLLLIYFGRASLGNPANWSKHGSERYLAAAAFDELNFNLPNKPIPITPRSPRKPAMTHKAKHTKHPSSASNSAQLQKPVKRLQQSKRIKKASAEKKPRSALSAASNLSKAKSDYDHSVTTEAASNSSLLDILWETTGQISNFFRKTFQRRPDDDMPERHSLPPRLAGH